MFDDHVQRSPDLSPDAVFQVDLVLDKDLGHVNSLLVAKRRRPNRSNRVSERARTSDKASTRAWTNPKKGEGLEREKDSEPTSNCAFRFASIGFV